jgi:hypothetical protein
MKCKALRVIWHISAQKLTPTQASAMVASLRPGEDFRVFVSQHQPVVIRNLLNGMPKCATLFREPQHRTLHSLTEGKGTHGWDGRDPVRAHISRSSNHLSQR